MLSALYTIIIYPLVLLTEFFFSFFSSFLSKGVSVIGLSFVVTLLTLPLYMVAESWSEKERLIEKKLQPGIQRIKETFTGDEQYMMLTTFYKENHYHPIMALRSSFSLLIQVPFFIAAYNFLSNLASIRGYSFLFIKDFGAPDEIFKIGSFSINILPIAMTVINCVAGFIYSKGHPLKEKIQIYGCAALFLVILYNSPAGLVLYWTMNNILSLVKNIFYKIKNPKKALFILLCCFSVLFIFAGIFILKNKKLFFRLFSICFGLILPLLPFLAIAVSKYFDSHFSLFDKNSNGKKNRFLIFFFSGISLAVLTGLVIPSFLMESEPQNFCYVDDIASPFYFLTSSFLQAIGFFVFWPSCFYFLFSTKIKNILAYLFPSVLFIALLNNFVFGGDYGPMDQIIVFMTTSTFAPTILGFIINTFLIIVIFATVIVLLNKFPKVVFYIPAILLIGLSFISVKNSRFVRLAFAKMSPPVVKENVEPIYHLSKTGKNVVFIMQDRYFSPFIPYVFEERPDLIEKFDGFTFYPNTISLGCYTMFGAIGVYGGYDYTPFEVNLRQNQSIREKHNESICTMPILFNSAGYTTTISDIPYENYSVEPVEQIYEPYPFINRIQTHNTYSDTWYKRHNLERPKVISRKIRRNLFCFSIFKIVPPIARRFVYHEEYWVSVENLNEFDKFIKSYSVLEFLPELFATDSEENSFVELTNLATHDPIFLQAPNYVPETTITNYGTSKFANEPQYHVIISATVKFAEFFDYLKENDVYDNTRIIIVSDHGTAIDVGDLNNSKRIPLCKESYTATLFFKDFNERGALKNDMTFMTNADAIDLATGGGVIENPTYPFTKTPIHKENKEDYVKIFTAPSISTRHRDKPCFKIKPTEWYTVKDNIFIDENWQQYKLKPGEEIVCK